jgi:DNA polymerase/3'-5' exonuclease PolX
LIFIPLSHPSVSPYPPPYSSLLEIPGIGKSIALDLEALGIRTVAALKGKNPERLYALHNKRVGRVEDRCLLYTFRCAVYYAEGGTDKEKLKWWNWKDAVK